MGEGAGQTQAGSSTGGCRAPWDAHQQGSRTGQRQCLPRAGRARGAAPKPHWHRGGTPARSCWKRQPRMLSAGHSRHGMHLSGRSARASWAACSHHRMAIGSPAIDLFPSQLQTQPYSCLCDADPTCVMILFSFPGQSLFFPGKAKGSPESGERLMWPRAPWNPVAESWRALPTLPLGPS